MADHNKMEDLEKEYADIDRSRQSLWESIRDRMSSGPGGPAIEVKELDELHSLQDQQRSIVQKIIRVRNA